MKSWVITTNFAEGLPYSVITMLSVVMFVDMGVDNAQVAAYTSLLALPWSFKALWSPLVSGSLRRWVWGLQWMLACTMAGVALALYASNWLPWVMVALAIGAFVSATYDMACDGLYLHALTDREQAYHVGIRTTAYRLSMLFASGVLSTLVGILARTNGDDLCAAWQGLMWGIGALMALLALLHGWLLPHTQASHSPEFKGVSLNEWRTAFVTFLHKEGLWFILLFLLLFRLAEALLSKMAIVFLKAPVSVGGLGLDNAEYGIIYGTVGLMALIIGGIAGGMLLSRYGLSRCVVPYALLLNVPDLLYVWMAAVQPSSRWLIGALVGVEQLGYGLGFTAYTFFLLRAAQGAHATSHYAILTALMALGMNLPSMLSGLMQEHLGYESFFWATVVCALPGILISILFKHLCPCRLLSNK